MWASLLQGSYPGAPVTAPLALLLGILLLRSPEGRRRGVFASLGIFAACLAVSVAVWLLERDGPATLTVWVRGAAGLLMGLCLVQLVAATLFKVLLPALRIQISWILYDLLLAIGFITWGILWLRWNQVNLAGLIATSAVLTAVIGFALQDTLGNLLGGLTLQLEDSVRQDDWIRLEAGEGRPLEGRVTQVRWRHTVLETREWTTVVVPNSQLIKGRFLLLGRRSDPPPRVRQEILFNVDFRTDPSRVTSVVEQALRTHRPDGTADTPEPDCIAVSFGESYTQYAARYWLCRFDRLENVASQARKQVFSALHRAGIPLSIPAQALFLTQDTRERRELKLAQIVEHRISLLSRTPPFSELLPEELGQLAASCRETLFAATETLTRQNSHSESAYLLLEGRAEVLVSDGDGHTARVAELGPGDLIGEMGVLAGEPRTATVVALEGLRALLIPGDAFKEIILSRPTAADSVAQVMARRRMGLDSARQDLDAEARAAAIHREHGDLLRRIRNFLGIS